MYHCHDPVTIPRNIEYKAIVSNIVNAVKIHFEVVEILPIALRYTMVPNQHGFSGSRYTLVKCNQPGFRDHNHNTKVLKIHKFEIQSLNQEFA